MIQLGDEHRRHPMQHSTTFLVHRRQGDQRVEPLHHHLRAAVREATHGRQHHPKAVKQRYADAALVFRRELHVNAREVSVVGDVVMGEHHPFRETGGSGGILHVHHIVTIGKRSQHPEIVIRHILSQQQDLCRVVHTPVFLLAYVDHILQFRKKVRFQLPPLCRFQFRHQFVDDVGIIASRHPVRHA